MTFLQSFYKYSIVKTRFLKLMVAILALYIVISILVSSLSLSTKVASFLLPFEISTPEELPFEAEETYVKIIGSDRVKIIYENNADQLVLWITTEIGWNNVSSWDEKGSLKNGIIAHYTESSSPKLSWRKDGLEYALDYSGSRDLDKNDLIKIANSISLN
ncbi:hypothetical protein [Alkalihalobacillus sp. AL-G]|uniref:hypothetical protein n=1 Tax=Alkalihalobacillus sp. AL-G TaxID=2926399 RepID=UPI00272A4596|nr:hypothetical protein [Alkalihalobacillus sp. AL-G]WLD94721.1 hypothetical protein MOJ78_07520 [Alkalihalobacillus sp. AL-G]